MLSDTSAATPPSQVRQRVVSFCIAFSFLNFIPLFITIFIIIPFLILQSPTPTSVLHFYVSEFVITFFFVAFFVAFFYLMSPFSSQITFSFSIFDHQFSDAECNYMSCPMFQDVCLKVFYPNNTITDCLYESSLSKLFLLKLYATFQFLSLDFNIIGANHGIFLKKFCRENSKESLL